MDAGTAGEVAGVPTHLPAEEAGEGDEHTRDDQDGDGEADHVAMFGRSELGCTVI
jgi:hypothetical protein